MTTGGRNLQIADLKCKETCSHFCVSFVKRLLVYPNQPNSIGSTNHYTKSYRQSWRHPTNKLNGKIFSFTHP